MKFIVSRTSGNYNEKPPCEGAFVARENRQYTNLWGIEINSLEDLLALCEKQQYELIITKYDNHGYYDWDGAWGIEIYDSYRE